MRNLLTAASLGLSALLLLAGTAAMSVRAADHLDGPNLTSPGGDGRLDITDIYAYQAPGNAGDTVLIMNVDPFTGVQATSTPGFRPDASYELVIDNTGKSTENIVYRVSFAAPAGGGQAVTLKDQTGATLATGQTGASTAIAGGGSLFAGLRDDPFFFDLGAFLRFKSSHNPAEFCGGTGKAVIDMFKGANVESIVLEVPTKALLGTAGNTIYVWGRTMLGGSQIDRMGKPALNTVFIPTEQKNAYNAGQPKDDKANFGSFFPANPIPLLGGSVTVRDLLLPDELILNTAGALTINGVSFSGYPNGRMPQDDVIDTSFTVLSNAGVLPAGLKSDCVGSHSTFSASFPYLGAPNALAATTSSASATTTAAAATTGGSPAQAPAQIPAQMPRTGAGASSGLPWWAPLPPLALVAAAGVGLGARRRRRT